MANGSVFRVVIIINPTVEPVVRLAGSCDAAGDGFVEVLERPFLDFVMSDAEIRETVR